MVKDEWATLYKQTELGRIQEWNISVEDNTVITEYGLVDGKHQITKDIIREGKNLGRSNATTKESQAILQAQQEWDGKIKEGYVPDIKIALSTKNTLEGIEPMLAHVIEKKEKYVTFPAWAQPKLDGLRMICIKKGDQVQLWSRTQKPYNTLPHIVEEIKTLFKGEDIILDGEAYADKFKNDFNAIITRIKRDELHPDHQKIQYHIYDVVAPGDFITRTQPLENLEKAKFCKRVETIIVNSREELEQYQIECVRKQFEGCMYRNGDTSYEHKRSSGLLKVKSFLDDEFKIVGVEEGSGKLMNAVGAFHCVFPDGRAFKATPSCTLEQKQDYWKRQKECIGKMATVKYQNITPDGSLRFPILKTIIDFNYRDDV